MGRNEREHHNDRRGKGPGTRGKTCGDNVGRGQLAAGRDDNLQRPFVSGIGENLKSKGAFWFVA